MRSGTPSGTTERWSRSDAPRESIGLRWGRRGWRAVVRTAPAGVVGDSEGDERSPPLRSRLLGEPLSDARNGARVWRVENRCRSAIGVQGDGACGDDPEDRAGETACRRGRWTGRPFPSSPGGTVAYYFVRAGLLCRQCAVLRGSALEAGCNQSVNSGALKCAMQPRSAPDGQARSPLTR